MHKNETPARNMEIIIVNFPEKRHKSDRSIISDIMKRENAYTVICESGFIYTDTEQIPV